MYDNIVCCDNIATCRHFKIITNKSAKNYRMIMALFGYPTIVYSPLSAGKLTKEYKSYSKREFNISSSVKRRVGSTAALIVI